eukprot:scaffold175527_cov64-Attheya_sp.AAC.2
MSVKKKTHKMVENSELSEDKMIKEKPRPRAGRNAETEGSWWGPVAAHGKGRQADKVIHDGGPEETR